MADSTETGFDPSFSRIVASPVQFRLFLLSRLPAAFFAGLKVVEANPGRCAVVVPYKWFTRNPFRSTYFACLSMAAEMSTGILAMGYVYNRKPSVSLLVVAVEGKFYKKAVSGTRFVCEEGPAIREAASQAIQTGNTARA